MVRLSDSRVGTKVSIMSGLGVLLMVAMIVVGMRGNAEMKDASDNSMVEQTLSRDFIDAKASIRGMQIGVRDIRLATSRDTLQRAMQYTDARLNSASRFIETSVPKLKSPEHRERGQNVRTTI